MNVRQRAVSRPVASSRTEPGVGQILSRDRHWVCVMSGALLTRVELPCDGAHASYSEIKACSK